MSRICWRKPTHTIAIETTSGGLVYIRSLTISLKSFRPCGRHIMRERGFDRNDSFLSVPGSVKGS